MWDFVCDYILPVLLVILIILGILTTGTALYFGINNTKFIIQTEEDICNYIETK